MAVPLVPGQSIQPSGSLAGHSHSFFTCSLYPSRGGRHTCIPLGEQWAALLCWPAVRGGGSGGVWEEIAGVARGPCGPPQPQPRSVHQPSLRPAFLPNVLPSPSLSSTPLSSPPFPSSPSSLGTEVLGNCFSSLEVPFCGRQHVLGALGRWPPAVCLKHTAPQRRCWLRCARL